MSNESLENGDYIGDELSVFALANNWKQYWSSKIKPLLGDNILEVGAGIGSNLAILKNKQQNWTALEPDAQQIIKIQELNVAQESNLKIIQGTLESITSEESFDTILYIDVLEHIQNDQTEVNNCMKHLCDGGKLIILSPAHQSLYSPFDKAIGHYRRYNKKTLRTLKPKNGIIEKLYYLDSVGYFASWLNAKILKSGMPTRSQIWLWDSVMIRFSKVFDPILNYKFGKTIIMVITKTAT